MFIWYIIYDFFPILYYIMVSTKHVICYCVTILYNSII